MLLLVFWNKNFIKNLPKLWHFIDVETMVLKNLMDIDLVRMVVLADILVHVIIVFEEDFKLFNKFFPNG